MHVLTSRRLIRLLNYFNFFYCRMVDSFHCIICVSCVWNFCTRRCVCVAPWGNTNGMKSWSLGGGSALEPILMTIYMYTVHSQPHYVAQMCTRTCTSGSFTKKSSLLYIFIYMFHVFISYLPPIVDFRWEH